MGIFDSSSISISISINDRIEHRVSFMLSEDFRNNSHDEMSVQKFSMIDRTSTRIPQGQTLVSKAGCYERPAPQRHPLSLGFLTDKVGTSHLPSIEYLPSLTQYSSHLSPSEQPV